MLAALVHRDALRQLCGVVRGALRSRAQIVAENALLRQQLLLLRQVNRPRVTPADRWWMVIYAAHEDLDVSAAITSICGGFLDDWEKQQ